MARPQVVWTRLVADLETPVSAYLKLSSGRADELPARIHRGRRRTRALLHHRPRPGRGVAHLRRPGRDQPAGAHAARPFQAREPRRRSQSLRALLAESRIDLPPELPPIAAGVIGYLGHDTVRLIERLPNVPPDSIGVPDGIFVRPTLMVVFDNVKDEMIVVTPVRPSAGRRRRAGGLCGRRGAPARRGAGRSTSPCRTQPRWPACNWRCRSGVQHLARRVHGHGGARQGVHRRRRHLPGGAVAALLRALHAAAVRALPRAPAHQPVAVPVPSRFRQLRAGGLVARDPGARARRRGDDPPARRHPAAAAPRPRRTRRWRPSCSPIPRSAPST